MHNGQDGRLVYGIAKACPRREIRVRDCGALSKMGSRGIIGQSAHDLGKAGSLFSSYGNASSGTVSSSTMSSSTIVHERPRLLIHLSPLHPLLPNPHPLMASLLLAAEGMPRGDRPT